MTWGAGVKPPSVACCCSVLNTNSHTRPEKRNTPLPHTNFPHIHAHSHSLTYFTRTYDVMDQRKKEGGIPVINCLIDCWICRGDTRRAEAVWTRLDWRTFETFDDNVLFPFGMKQAVGWWVSGRAGCEESALDFGRSWIGKKFTTILQVQRQRTQDAGNSGGLFCASMWFCAPRGTTAHTARRKSNTGHVTLRRKKARNNLNKTAPCNLNVF